MHDMMHTQLSILAVEHPFERRAFAVSSALVAILFFAYLYFVAASVLNIVARKEADAHATNLGCSIAASIAALKSPAHVCCPAMNRRHSLALEPRCGVARRRHSAAHTHPRALPRGPMAAPMIEAHYGTAH